MNCNKPVDSLTNIHPHASELAREDKRVPHKLALMKLRADKIRGMHATIQCRMLYIFVSLW